MVASLAPMVAASWRPGSVTTTTTAAMAVMSEAAQPLVALGHSLLVPMEDASPVDGAAIATMIAAITLMK